jgi:polysaccharide biosynthesis protein PslH
MLSPNLSILFVMSHCPYAPSYGTQLRVLNIAKLLSRIGKVSLVIAPYFPIDEGSLDRTRREFDVKRIIHLTRNNRRNVVDRVRNELDPTFLKTDGIEASEGDREAVLRMINEYDVVWVHTIQTANAFRIYQWPHTVIDIDDIPSRFFASAAKSKVNVAESLLSYRRSFLWRRRERLLKKRFSLISVCSEGDRQYLGGDSQIHVIPNGFSRQSQEPKRTPTVPARLGFIGTFEYVPNRIGAEWFINKVWPRVKKEAPETKLRLVGSGSDEYFPRMGPDIDGLGYVEDPTVEIASWSAMIVPVRLGAGTRVKIPEAFSRKCPVVSTSLGAFGYKVLNGQDLLLADDAQDFASACVLLLKSTELGLRLSENAWKKFLDHWTWDSIGASVSNAVNECLNRSNC